MASALLQGARPRVEQDHVPVANTVRLGPALCRGLFKGSVRHTFCRSWNLHETRRLWVLLCRRLQQCRPVDNKRNVHQAWRQQIESVQDGRLHHACLSTRRLHQARGERNVPV